VVPEGTVDDRLELTFAASAEFDPEDLVDKLYEANESQTGRIFDVRYADHNEFIGGYVTPLPQKAIETNAAPPAKAATSKKGKRSKK
jgi:hypothetical protein